MTEITSRLSTARADRDRIKRHVGLALLWLLLVATALGCRPDAPPAENEPSTLTIRTGYSDRAMFFAGGTERYLMFLPLMAINDRGEIEGRLAQSWELSADDSTWTIRLRSDVRWHDGVPVTAHDIKFTIDLLTDPEVLWWSPDRAKATVLDDTTVTIIFRSGYGEEPELWMRTVYLPQHLLEGLDPATFGRWDFWLEPVGNGPYRFVRRVPETMFELEANPEFYLGRPRIDRVIIRRAGPSAAELLSGNVDVMYASPLLASGLAQDPRFRVYYGSSTSTRGIAWNQDRYPPFRDRRIRRALTQAIDRRELLAVLDLPDSTPIYDVAMSFRQFRRGEYPDPVPYDPDAARRLLEEAGWRDADGDGIREQAGEEFRFTMLVRRGEVPEATYVQAALRRVGIGMEIEMSPTSPDLVPDADFEAGILWFFVRLRRGNLRLGTWLGRGSPIGYHNPIVDSLLARAQETRQSLEEFEDIYRELMPIMQEDLPITFLYAGTNAYVAHRRVRGLSSPWRAAPHIYIDQLWIEDER